MLEGSRAMNRVVKHSLTTACLAALCLLAARGAAGAETATSGTVTVERVLEMLPYGGEWTWVAYVSRDGHAPVALTATTSQTTEQWIAQLPADEPATPEAMPTAEDAATSAIIKQDRAALKDRLTLWLETNTTATKAQMLEAIQNALNEMGE